jgi:hypothetical protein
MNTPEKTMTEPNLVDDMPEKPSDDQIADMIFDQPEFERFNAQESFDGSEEEEPKEEPEEEVKVEETPAGAASAAEPAAEAAVDGVAAPESAPAPSEVELLKAELAEIQRKHEEDRELWKQSLQRQVEPPKVQEPQNPQERKQVFALNIPAKLGEDLLSEDPNVRQQALTYYTNAVAHEVYHKTREDLLQEMHSIARSHATGTVAQVSAQEEVAKDFYGTFPELAKPQYGPHIMQIAGQVMQELGAKTWNAKVRDEVGRRSKELFGVSSTTPTAPAPKPAVASVRAGNGSRAPVVQPKSKKDGDVLSFLGLD